MAGTNAEMLEGMISTNINTKYPDVPPTEAIFDSEVTTLRKLLTPLYTVSDETIQMTEHVHRRCRERGITLDEIKHCIMDGEIIEDYPADYPFPSALVLGCEISKPLHVVAGVSGEYLWIITVYYPSADKWENDFKTRKGQ